MVLFFTHNYKSIASPAHPSYLTLLMVDIPSTHGQPEVAAESSPTSEVKFSPVSHPPLDVVNLNKLASSYDTVFM